MEDRRRDVMRRWAKFVIVVLLLSISLPQIEVFAHDYPDLILLEISVDDEIIEGRETTITANISNSRGDFSQNFSVALIVDNEAVDVTVEEPIRGGTSRNITFRYTFTSPGYHTIRVEADYYNEVYESNESNNSMVILVYVNKTKPDLTIEKVTGIPPFVNDSEKIEVNVSLRNLGHEVDERFYVTLRIGDVEEDQIVDEKVPVGGIYNLSFEITVRGFGYTNAQVRVDSKDDINESNEDNNVWEKEVFIYRFLPWFNETFHYRLLATTKGKGRCWLKLDFSKLLNEDLGIDADFYINSTRVVQYKSNGEIGNDSIIFHIEKTDSGYNLTWFSPEKGYYMIYFDVLENGEKENVSVESITATENTTAEFVLGPEAWRLQLIKPANGSVFPANSPINVSLRSCAILDQVNVSIYLEGEKINASSLETADNLNFSKELRLTDEGNYTLNFTARDKAGYTQNLSISIYIGKIDLRIESLSVNDKLYQNMPAQAEAKVVSNIPVKELPIRIELNITHNDVALYQEVFSFTLNGSSGTFSLSFIPEFSGDGKLIATLYPPEGIDDANWSNNIISKDITVYMLPDLKVVKMFAPQDANEGVPLVVHVLVKNDGDEKIDTKISLHVSREDLIWKSTEIKDYRYVEIPPRRIVNVSLTWEYPEAGTWIVGVEAKPKDIREGNVANSRMVSIVKVKEGEHNPPTLEDLWCEPIREEVGRSVKVCCILHDDTGIENVTLTIIYPDGTEKNFSMILSNGIWIYEFLSLIPGEYRCYVTAVDSSPIHNIFRSNTTSFYLREDSTPPLIRSVWIKPKEKQLVNETVEIGCLISDNVGVEKVNTTLVYPDGRMYKIEMSMESENRFVFRRSFDEIGQYSFFVVATDVNGNRRESSIYSFWITEDLNDTDGDGLPDWWEEMYGLNPKDPDDAKGDMDGDGIMEIKEYAEGLNPTKPDTLWRLSQYEMAILVIVLIILLAMATLIAGRRS